MKAYTPTFLLVLFLLFYSKINSQTIMFLGYTSGEIVPVDTVVFGFANNATIGIDETLGEVDITDHPIDSFDLRVIQRTAEDFECLYDENAEPVHFPTSFESKVNLRPIIPDSEEENSLYFEVINYSYNFTGGYDIVLVDYVRNITDPADQYFMSISSSFDCHPDNNMFLGSNLFAGSPFPLISLTVLPKPLSSDDDWYTHFYFKLERDITTNTDEPSLPSYKIYPNPADEFVNLEKYNYGNSSYELYNIQGQLVKQGEFSSVQTKVNTADLPAGSYIVKILSNNGQVASRSLISVY